MPLVLSLVLDGFVFRCALIGVIWLTPVQLAVYYYFVYLDSYDDIWAGVLVLYWQQYMSDR